VAVRQAACRPAGRYALLGGYLVTPVGDRSQSQPGACHRGRFAIIAGKRGFAGSDAGESLGGYELEPAVSSGGAPSTRNENHSLFAGSAGGLTRDSGTLTIEASRSLNLAGSLAPQVGDGLGPRVDIVADSLSIVSGRSNTPGVVELMANDLSRFGAASLLIGGRNRGEHQLTAALRTSACRECARGRRESSRCAGQHRHCRQCSLTAAAAVEQSEERLLVSAPAIASVSARRP
jgi:hypothetical protein